MLRRCCFGWRSKRNKILSYRFYYPIYFSRVQKMLLAYAKNLIGHFYAGGLVTAMT